MASKAKNREKPCEVGWRSDRLDTQMIGRERITKAANRIMPSISPGRNPRFPHPPVLSVTNHSVPGRSRHLAWGLPPAPSGEGPRSGRARGVQDTATVVECESEI